MPNDQPEPLSAILAEMRDPPHKWEGFSRADLARLADRVEAAVNLREHNLCVMLATRRRDLDTVIRENEAIREQRDNLLAAHEYDRRALVDATSPGNAAAMRAALEEIYNEAQNICDFCDEQRIVSHRADKIERIVNTALAAPARNADRFKTMEAARSAFRKFCRENYNSSYAAAGLDGCDDCELCETKNMSGEDICPFAWLFAPAKEGGSHA